VLVSCKRYCFTLFGVHSPSMVGSYSSTKWLWISWMVRQDFPTPPPPTTTSLYSRRNCARSVRDCACCGTDRGRHAPLMPLYVCMEGASAAVELVAVRRSCCGATGKSRARWGSIGEAGGRGDALLGAANKGGNSARGVGATGYQRELGRP
jgi:hypothetical protein